MNRIRLLFLFFLLLVGSADLVAKANEGQVIDCRTFDQERIDEIKNQTAYIYNGEAPVRFWDQFIEWLIAKLTTLFDGASERQISIFIKIIQGILWGLGIFAVVMIFFSLFKYGAFNPLKKENKLDDIEFNSLEEKVLETNWQELIDLEINAGKYNVALRLLFLQSIQLLNEKQLICWEKNKTNYDYLRELRKTNFETSFKNLIQYYNFGWFGDFEIKEWYFSDIHSEFKAFNNSIC